MSTNQLLYICRFSNIIFFNINIINEIAFVFTFAAAIKVILIGTRGRYKALNIYEYTRQWNGGGGVHPGRRLVTARALALCQL